MQYPWGFGVAILLLTSLIAAANLLMSAGPAAASAVHVLAAGTALPTPSPSSGGDLTWGTLAVAVIAAVLAGGFFGNMFASNRLRPPRVSVYAVIEQRLKEMDTANAPKEAGGA